MADSLCGPSNALQSFQKHSSVDRTLQQDRLVSRQSPSQGFRSHDATAGTLDPEFEAFQAGHAPPPAFAGPVFPSDHAFVSNQSHIHPASPAASTSAPSWTQDFQRLNLSQPQHTQRTPHAWHSQFNQNVKSPTQFQPPSTQYQTQPLHFRPSPAFFQSQSPFHMQASNQAMKQPETQAPPDQFDEAAFEAAFDQAMADATTDQDQVLADSEQEQRPLEVDLRPYLPLFRLALAYAVVANTDESLHKAALVINNLRRHGDLTEFDLMLFRPLLSALKDPKRSLFSERYGFDQQDPLLDAYHHGEKTPMAVDQTTERLLAAYADLVWQRDQSNNLSTANKPRSADNAKWLDKLYDRDDEETAEAFAGSLTADCVRLLNNDFQRQIIPDQNLLESQSLSRVLELEFDALNQKFPSAGITRSSHPEETQASLFTLMEAILEAPETVETLEHLRHQAQINQTEHDEQMKELNEESRGDQEHVESRRDNQDHAFAIFQRELMLLEQHNKPRLLAARAEQQQQEARAEQLAQEASEERHAQEVMQAQRAEETIELSDPSHHQFEERPQMFDPGHNQFEEQPQQQQQPHNQEHDDELAQTAADLLERVSHNKTDKFKNSTFLGLMRQLADREVRVEGDKVVPTNEIAMSTGVNAQQFTPMNQQPLDAGESYSNNQQSNVGPQDGQEVADLLNQPESIVSNQDSEFMMTSPFAHPQDY